MEELKKESKKKEASKLHSILYVDDEHANLRVFNANFRKYYNVFITDDPYEAINILDNEDIKLIVTDQRMPDMTGIELLGKIEADYPYIVKIILTGFTDVEVIKEGINRYGIFKFITKPWVFEEMHGAIERGIDYYHKSFKSGLHIKKLELSNSKLEKEVEEKSKVVDELSKKLEESIRYGGLLQKAMLPSDRYLRRQFNDHFMIYLREYLFSDEFIWTTQVNFRHEHYLIIALLELEGMGIIGALKTLIADSVLNYLIHDKKIFNPYEIASELNAELDAKGNEELKCEKKFSILVFDINERKLSYCGKGQDMLIFDNKRPTRLRGDFSKESNSPRLSEVSMKKNQSYYVFSSGFYNQKNEDGVKFSYEKFEEMLKAGQEKDMELQKDFILGNLESWKAGNKLNDNISILGFKF